MPVSASKPKFSLLEAPGVSVWRPKPHVFVVAGALPRSLTPLHPWAFLHLCIPGISLSLHPGHLCILGISEYVSWSSLHPARLCISPSWASVSLHPGISPSQVGRQPDGRAGAQPPCSAGVLQGVCQGSRVLQALRCYHFSLRV